MAGTHGLKATQDTGGRKKMPSVNERLATLESQRATNNEQTKQIWKAIYGNGEAGLLREFALLRRSVEEHHQKIDDKNREKKADWKWLVPTIAAVLAAVGAFMR